MRQPFSSGFKLGILGGGQLGKMLSLAGHYMDLQTYALDPTPNCPCKPVSTQCELGSFNDFDDVVRFGKMVDLLTIEIEHVNIEALEHLESIGVHTHPKPSAIRIIQDKGLQKLFYQQHGLPTASFSLYESKQEVLEAIEQGTIRFPFVQKSRKAGYDGKGVSVIESKTALHKLLEGACVIEEKVAIQREISAIVAKDIHGHFEVFPIVEMVVDHRANLVDYLVCPAAIAPEVAQQAATLAIETLKAFDFYGLLAVEMFLDAENNLLVNEVAPRPHNSGHHTIESCVTSQFQQHLRSVLGLPLGETTMKIPAMMLNLVGEDGYEGAVKLEGLEEVMALSGVHLHLYGKEITKPFRKMGHFTILDSNLESAYEKVKIIKEKFRIIA